MLNVELQYAQSLAKSIWEKHYKALSPDFEVFPDLFGVLTQIDNMITGLEKRMVAVHKTNEQVLYQKAVNHFGWIQQLDMVVEECAELILALQHFIRNKASADDVVNEIADVEIMCAQMRRLLFPGVDDAKVKKLERLERLIQE